MIDFGFSISKSSHIQMDDVDLKLFNKLETLCPDIKTCMACGLCTATCTAGNFTDVSFRQIILMLQRGKEKEALQKVKKCMMCGKCLLVCSRGINTRNILLSITRIYNEAQNI
ncbi:MAG: (4Fe-4S)-binding protein [Lentimicrobiaceae bacterium]|nr:(4Fe-4S)-binding protein [Lentimicrobiaceae bacterium]